MGKNGKKPGKRSPGVARLLAVCLVLAVVDGLSIWLAFGLYGRLHLRNFPLALINLMAVLIAADAVALFYPSLKRRFGSAYAMGWGIAVGGYAVLTVALTALFYWRTPSRIFTGGVLAALAAYAAVCLLLLLTRKRRRRRRDTAAGSSITLHMLELGGCVHALQPAVDPRHWEGLNKAYIALRTCWEFAAPFGRSALPVVTELEKEIARRVEETAGLLQGIPEKPPGEAEAAVQAAARELLDIAEQLRSREKLLLG